MERAEILKWLQVTDEVTLEELWKRADAARSEHVGDAVHLRGLIEISNTCRRLCGYCGLRADNVDLTRYRMTTDEIVACAKEGESYGYGTAVLQAGEDPGLDPDEVVTMIQRIKAETKLAVTLSLGEHDDAIYQKWKDAGADRYLLRYETSDPDLFQAIHPPLNNKPSLDRIAILKRLRTMGYEIGSGIMIGIPGQSWELLADEILKFKEIDLDMVGVGPFLPHPATPMGQEGWMPPMDPGENQVPNDELTTRKVVALTRIILPKANLPATSALATINTKSGREHALQGGANVVMPNLTPVDYRKHYEIYPAKACIYETAGECRVCLQGRIRRIGRHVGDGQGASPAFSSRLEVEEGV